MRKSYRVRNIRNQNLWWSNETGWGSREGADRYTEKERTSLNLPMEGCWVVNPERKTYFVSWEMEIIAESPRDAAERALEIQRDPDSMANAFKISDGKEVFTIDLMEDK